MSIDLTHKVQKDPLDILPYDILLEITMYLSIEDTFSFMGASWHVFLSTRENSFWKSMMHTHLQPWFWELSDFLSTTTLPACFDLKGLFLWLNDAATPAFGLTGSFMGIANRRRIWNTCKQLVPQYGLKSLSNDYVDPDDHEAKAVLDTAVCLQTPLVHYPQPEATETSTMQFLRSWKELSRGCEFSTYWGRGDELKGIAVGFGSNQRIFGDSIGCRGESVFIDADEWIKEIVVWTKEVSMSRRKNYQTRWKSPIDAEEFVDSSITGLEVSISAPPQLINERKWLRKAHGKLTEHSWF